MTSQVTIKNCTSKGELLEATFLPHKGMNLVSFKKGDIEVIDQSTYKSFKENYCGLGALIGPHFLHRNPKVIPSSNDETLFPHIASLKKEGLQDPFYHGIARYSQWKAEASETEIKGSLTGKDELHGVPLKLLEGQDFKITFDAEMTKENLSITISVVSDTASLMGLDYHYALSKGKGIVTADTLESYEEEGVTKQIPSTWDYKNQHIHYDLNHSANFHFFPFLNPLSGNILLQTENYQLRTIYNCVNEENCWRLFHPPGNSYVCISPMSAKNPQKPQLTVSFLKVKLEILSP